MKTKSIITIMIAVAMTSCDLESDSCPRVLEVPFVNVEIPDTVEVDQAFTIDVKVYDYGCYKGCEVTTTNIGDTIFLSAIANYDKCGCPEQSVHIERSYIDAFDSTARDKAKYYVYSIINSQDTIHFQIDTVWVY
jgi:hypothetical protein